MFPRWLALLAFCALPGCNVAEPPSATADAAVPLPPSAAPLPPARAATGHDAFVVLSGGGSPTSNNYSQFVQARAMAEFFRRRYSRDAVWTFFGAGNREGERPAIADVYRQVERDGVPLDTWLPGALPENRGATKDAFLDALRREILPRVRDGGTLFLFVGDHGELTRGRNGQSAITMWGLRRDATRPNGWANLRDATLSVDELRGVLASGLGAGRVVFAMTQCHSGGFHDLGLEGGPLAWRAAGFTATDQASIAAGCDPDPDPERWAGYERFWPEALLGADLLSGAAHGAASASFANAHAAAVLVDFTIDKPRSTAERFLERWAGEIEDMATQSTIGIPGARAALETYRRAIDRGGAAAPPDDAAWREMQVRFAEFTAQMIAQNPAAQPLLVQADRATLEAAIERQDEPAEDEDRDAPAMLTRAQLQPWREVIRPAWNRAVAAGEASELPANAVAFEKRLENAEGNRGRGHMFNGTWPERVLEDLYWSSSYADPATFEAGKAEALTRWFATRADHVLAWAGHAADPAVRRAAEKMRETLAASDRAGPAAGAPKRILPRSTAAERELFQRRVLAAWAFLIGTNRHAELEQLHALLALERTPLP